MEPTIKHEFWKTLKSPEIFRTIKPFISPYKNSKETYLNQSYTPDQQLLCPINLPQPNPISFKVSSEIQQLTHHEPNSSLSNETSIEPINGLQLSSCSRDKLQRSSLLSPRQQESQALEAELELQKKQLLEQLEKAKIVESCFIRIQEEIKQKSIKIELHEKNLLEREEILMESEQKLIKKLNEVSSNEVKLQIRERQLKIKEEELRLAEIRVESKQASVEKSVEMFERVSKRFNEEKKIILAIKKANENKESLIKIKENKPDYCDKGSLETLLNVCGIEDTEDIWSEEYSQKSNVFIN